MKKLIVMFVAVMLLAGTAFAQDAEKKGRGPRGDFDKDAPIKIEDVKNEKFAEHLKKVDADNDGVVTKEERAAFHEKMKAEFAKKDGDKKNERPEAKKGEGKKKGDAKKGDAKKGEGKKKGDAKKGEGKKKPDAKKGDGPRGPRPDAKRGEGPRGPRPDAKRGEGPRPELKDVVIADVKNERFAEMMKKADTDNDGTATVDEQKAAMKAFMEARKAKEEKKD